VSIFGFLVLAVCLGIGGFIYVKTQLKPEQIKLYSIEKLQEIFPGTIVSVRDVELSVTSSIALLVSDVSIIKSELQSNSDLLNVASIKIEVPFLSLLLGGGNFDVTCDSPKILVGKDTWKVHTQALSHDKTKGKDQEFSEIIIPSFMANSTVDVRTNNMELSVLAADGERREIKLDRAVLKNFGVRSSAGFEIKNVVDTSLFGREVQFNLTSIGSFDFSKYLKSGQLEIVSSYKIQNLSIGKAIALKKVIHGGLKTSLGARGIVAGELTFLGERSKIKTDFEWSNRKIQLSEILGDVFLSDFSDFLSRETPFDFGTAVLSLAGSLSIEKDGYNPKVRFSLAQVGQMVEGNKLLHSLKGRLEDNKISLNLDSEGFGGNATAQIEANFNLMSSEPIEKRLRSYSTSIAISGMTLTEAAYKNFFSFISFELLRNQTFFLLPKGSVNFSVSDVLLKGTQINATGVIETDLDAVLLRDIKLEGGSGSATFRQEMTLLKESFRSKSSARFSNFDLDYYNVFLPSSRPRVRGIINGRFLSETTDQDSMEIDFNIIKGSFTNLDINEEVLNIRKILMSLPSIAGETNKDSLGVIQAFSELTLKGRFTKNVFDIKELALVSAKENFLIEGKGKLRKTQGPGIRLYLSDNANLSQKWKLYTGSSKIPIAVKMGKGGLYLDKYFTMKLLASKMLRKRGRVFTQATLKKEVASLIESVGEKQATKILKGVLK